MHAPRGTGFVVASVVMLVALAPGLVWAQAPAEGGGDAPAVTAGGAATDAPAEGAGRERRARQARAQRGRGGGAGRAAGARFAPAPAIAVAEGYVFVVQRGTLYQFTVDSLEEIGRVRLNVPGQRGRRVAAGGGQGGQAGQGGPQRIRVMVRAAGADEAELLEGDLAELENADLGPEIRQIVQTLAGGPRGGGAQAAPAISVSEGYVFVVYAGTLFQFTVDSLEELGKVRLNPPARRVQVFVEPEPARD